MKSSLFKYENCKQVTPSASDQGSDQEFKSLQLTISNFSVPSLLLFSLASSSPLSSASSPFPSSSACSSSLPSPSPSLAPSPSSIKSWIHMMQDIRLPLLKEESVVALPTHNSILCEEFPFHIWSEIYGDCF